MDLNDLDEILNPDNQRRNRTSRYIGEFYFQILSTFCLFAILSLNVTVSRKISKILFSPGVVCHCQHEGNFHITSLLVASARDHLNRTHLSANNVTSKGL